MSELKKHISKLEEFLKELPDYSPWEYIEIVEMDSHGKFIGSPMPVEEYEDTFDKILDVGFPWVNLSAYGKKEQTLIITLEKPFHQPKVKSPRTSVNFSGPNNLVRKNSDWQITL